jgi:hypothetical protein
VKTATATNTTTARINRLSEQPPYLTAATVSRLRNPQAPRWDWDEGIEPYGACFPRGISFGDVDAEIEINRRFLVIEGKRLAEPLNKGQEIAMRQRYLDGRTILLVTRNPPLGIATIQHWPHGAVQSADWRTFHELCRRWAEWAQAQKPPPFRISTFTTRVGAPNEWLH